MTALSLRRLWTRCIGASKRDLALLQLAFYNYARGALKDLDLMIAEGDYEELHKTIDGMADRSNGYRHGVLERGGTD